MDKIQNFVVFESGPPLFPTESGISSGINIRKTAISRVGGGWIVPADTKFLEQIHVWVGSNARRHQARETGAGFGEDPRSPDASEADLSIAVEVDFSGAVEAAVVESAGEGRHAGLVRVPPTQRAKYTVFLTEPVVD